MKLLTIQRTSSHMSVTVAVPNPPPPPPVRGALGREWGSVCPLLQQLLRQTDSPGAVKARVLRCLSSWVLLDVPLNESEDLVHDCFSALPDPELFDTAVEAVVNAISQPDSQRCVRTRTYGGKKLVTSNL